MAVEALQCKECGASYPLEARYVCDDCFGPLEVSLRLLGPRRRSRRGGGSRPGRSHLALRRLPAVRDAAAHGARRRRDAAASAPTGSPSGSASARCGSRTTPPTRRTRSRTAWSRWRSPRPRSSATRSSPAPRPATWPTPSPPTRPPRGSSPTCSSRPTSRSRRSSRPGVYGTNLVAVRGNYDDVNRLCTELSGERDWAFVNVNVRPYYAEGSKTLAYEIAEQLGCELPDRVVAPIASGSLFTKIARGFEEWLEVGLVEGELPDVQRRPGRGLLARRPGLRGGPRRLPAGQAGHDRQVARDRQPGRRPVRARAGAALRRRRSTP